MHFVANELAKDFKPTFLSVPKDQETIWKKLLVESKPYSDYLKRLLIINEPDCLDRSQYQYQTIIDNMSLKEMKKRRYIGSVPRLKLGEHEEIKTYLLVEFDNFVPSGNPEFKDGIIVLTIFVNIDAWELEDYGIRPWAVAGYINGILDESELSGIGRLTFLGAEQIVLDNSIAGVSLQYLATHSEDNADDGEKISRLYPE